MKITTIRHGETDWNLARRIQGSNDIPLNEAGLNQAERLAKRLAGDPCDVIFTSDLQRAKKTAEIINSRHNVELITSPKLREQGFADFEGKTLTETAVFESFSKFMDEHAPVDLKKVGAYIDEILLSDYKNIFIVSHFGTIRAVICHLLKLSAEQRDRYYIGNTAIHSFERDVNGEFFITLDNDTAHLD